MANESPAAVVAAVRKSDYAGMLRKAFGEGIFADTEKAFNGIVQALEAYQQRYTEFYPYTSKYDAYLSGSVKLTESETRGLALFNDPAKGKRTVISAPVAPTARRRSSRITDWPLLACHATLKFPPMWTRRFTISGCAGRCAGISMTDRNIAGCSSLRACATSHCAGRFSTTASSTP
jgi:Di-haem cytochrome c peroxidase